MQIEHNQKKRPKQRNLFDSRSMGQVEEQQKDLITVFTLEEPLFLKGRKQSAIAKRKLSAQREQSSI